MALLLSRARARAARLERDRPAPRAAGNAPFAHPGRKSTVLWPRPPRRVRPCPSVPGPCAGVLEEWDRRCDSVLSRGRTSSPTSLPGGRWARGPAPTNAARLAGRRSGSAFSVS